LTKEELQELENAAACNIKYDEESPEMTKVLFQHREECLSESNHGGYGEF